MNSTNVQGIRFRAFDKINNRMIYPCSSKNDTYLVFEESGWFIVDHFSGKNETILKSEDGDLMRFTGLRDKSGKEIYDRDMVKDEYGNIGTIVWNQQDCSFCVEFNAELQALTQCDHPAASNFNDWLEVIGHIYQTPNLGEDNSTTSNRQNYVHVDDAGFPQSEMTFTSTDTSGYNPVKRQTSSYKTELGKMTRQRNFWFMAFCIASFFALLQLGIDIIIAIQS